MLVKVNPHEVGKIWNHVIETLRESMPPEIPVDDVVLANIYNAILLDEMQCWAAVKYGNGNTLVYGLVVTTISHDFNARVDNLLIYAVYNMGRVIAGHDVWKADFETLKAFARAKGCKKVVGYSDIQSVIDFYVNDLGGRAHTVLEVDA